MGIGTWALDYGHWTISVMRYLIHGSRIIFPLSFSTVGVTVEYCFLKSPRSPLQELGGDSNRVIEALSSSV